ncbi:MAG: endonuclease domain-containing protein [Myxococcaceae bacterium]
MPRPETELARRLRLEMTGTEWRVWNRLKGKRLDGWKFRRQHPIGPYVVDFCCLAARLVVEVDCPELGNDPAEAYDLRRTAWLACEGYRVLRFPVTSVDDDLDSVIDSIYQELERSLPIPRLRRVLPRGAGK